MNSNDLNQIAHLLDQKLEEKLELKLEEKLTQKLNPIEKELKEHGKMLQSLKSDQDTMLKMLDKEQMEQRRRLKKVEDHLELTSSIS